MRSESKKSAFFSTVRIVLLVYVAALFQFCVLVNCACAKPDAGGYEQYGISGRAEADFMAPCCCAPKSGSETDGVNKNQFEGSTSALCGVQASCCCVSDNDPWGFDAQAVVSNFELKLTFDYVFRVVMPSFCMASDPHGAYPAGYYAEVLSSTVSPHIASTILLL